PRPELDPLGIRAAGFLIYPSLAVSEQYNDNIFADDLVEVDDFITFIRPGVKVKSDWNNHALNFRADANIAKYADNGDEDYENYTFGTDGRLDITRNQSLFANALYSHLTQIRGDPDDVRRGRFPGEYDLYRITGGYNHRFNRLSVRLEGTGARYDYDNIPANVGPPINQDVRDRTDGIGTLRAAYELSPGYSAFVLGSYINRAYDERDTDDDIERSSDGYEVGLGTELALTGVTTGEVYVGYRSQFYDDPNLDTIDGITGGASIYWNVTTLTTITGRVERTIEDTTFNTTPTVGGTRTPSSGYFSTRYGFIVDHELLRNLLLQASLFGLQQDFSGIDRTDDVLLATVGAKYLMNRYLDLSIGYGYTDRSSDTSDDDYLQNTAMLTVNVKL
ncbi:MAG: outer membrane beta-barrel protein, partial [Gammaproteobacteria bacterium]